ncbi:Rv1355c family protein [Pedobacter sp.]|uniref:Rv1355c family protein n=1 Tax=Pedobacter sp. TaxID=1411316 RepID=UPI003D7F6F81
MQPKVHLTSILPKLTDNTNQLKKLYKPIIYNLSDPNDVREVNILLETINHIQVFDEIESQVKELIKCLHPSVILSETEITEKISEQLGNKTWEEYGVWVYYPWSCKLVHILEEHNFIIVRTNRNKHKITEAEQACLSKKKIGVMGLSVGQSVSLTLAMERGFGELRIADFDELDLSNLNRIRTGVHHLKLSKTVIVAREIAEMDPFLKVVCFNEGITESNLVGFLTENGTLDLLIDECDSFDVKISAREKAKELGIPVLMEGSDRCTIDIERFDLEPNRPVLHGFVKDLNMSTFKTLKTLDEKLQYIAPVTGVETLSPRMKASAIEIMSSISTWPQLASAVTYGGGITADLSRKILLNNLEFSGRFFVDIDELISNPNKEETIKTLDVEPIDIKGYLKVNHAHFPPALKEESLAEEVLNNLITAANKAPSGGNNQPWLWHYSNNILHLFLNKPVSGAYLDPEFISSYIALGAAIKNMELAAAINNLKMNWQFTPELFPDHIATFNFTKGHIPSEKEKSLASKISDRYTNRKIGIANDPNPEEFKNLQSIVREVENADLQWITNQDQLQALGEIAGEADLLRMFIPEAHQDFITKEMRWTVEETQETSDGIGIHSLDLGFNDQIGLRLMKDKKAVEFLKTINGGAAFKKLALKQFSHSTAIGLITLPKVSSINFINGGLAVENLWLKAIEYGYEIHPVNVPLIFFYKNNFQVDNGLSKEDSDKISEMYQRFKNLFKIENNMAEVFLFRIFKAEKSQVRTIRKPINKTLSLGTE